LLEEVGVALDSATDQGDTALDFAREAMQSEMVAFLIARAGPQWEVRHEADDLCIISGEKDEEGYDMQLPPELAHLFGR
jgi:hypothetical protein